MMSKELSLYRQINKAWPHPIPVPTPDEAVRGVKKLLKRAHEFAIENGAIPSRRTLGLRRYKFEVVKDKRRHTSLREGVWYVNPNEKHCTLECEGGWAEIVHKISHWAQKQYWPHAGQHGYVHAEIEYDLANYTIENLL